MKTNAIVKGSLAALSLLFLALPAHGQASAQAPIPPSPDWPGPDLQVQTGPEKGFAVAFNDKVEVVKGHGYQADAVTETVQTLADGSHITHKMTATVARDAEGRTLRAETLDGMGLWGSAADKREVRITMVFDPVAGTHIHWQSDSKIATVMPMPPLHKGAIGNGFFSAKAGPDGEVFTSGGIVTSAGVAPSGGVTTGIVEAGGPIPAGASPDTVVVHRMQDLPEKPDAASSSETTEQLGKRMIEGVEAVGTRATQIIPAGTIGNDKELVSTRETWFAPELKIIVMSIRNDPRFGQIRYTLNNVQVTEPDPSLFQPPAGYTIVRPRGPGM